MTAPDGRLRGEARRRIHLEDALAERAHDPPAAGVGPAPRSRAPAAIFTQVGM